MRHGLSGGRAGLYLPRRGAGRPAAPGSRHGLPGGMSRPCGQGDVSTAFLASLCRCGPEFGQGLRKAVTGGHFCSSSAMRSGQPRDPRQGDRAPGSQGGSGRVRHTPRWCGVSTAPVSRLEKEASAQSLTDQDINDRLAGGAVSSDAALAIRQATACPGFGARPAYLPAGQVAGAGAAQRAQVAGQSRGARC
jgi:hypothetical protein